MIARRNRALARESGDDLFPVLLLVWKFDRLGRSLNSLISCLEMCRSLGIDFVSVTESVDTSLPSGELVFQMIRNLACPSGPRKGSAQIEPPIFEDHLLGSGPLRRFFTLLDSSRTFQEWCSDGF